MILVGFTFSQVVVTTLWVTLILLIVILIYRKLIKSWSKNELVKKDFFVLYSLEESPVIGEAPFYFTSELKKGYKLSILDADMKFLVEVSSGEAKLGGNIIRYDSTQLEDGEYFYSLESENQKISKKMKVFNNG